MNSPKKIGIIYSTSCNGDSVYYGSSDADNGSIWNHIMIFFNPAQL